MAPPTLAAASEAIHARQLSAVELLDECLERIDEWEPRLRSLLARDVDAAVADAERADSELARGESRGPLHGIPLVVKDHIDVAGVVTTAGSRILADNVARADATVVARLRQAGALLLAKANTHEFAFGATTPPTRNPWDLGCIPGGSSGGSGAAVGAGLVPGALGTDSGASIREPAALCGVVGLKPTLGRVSCRGVVPFAWSLDAVGPMARTVVDVALLQAAIEGRAEQLAADPAPARTAATLRIVVPDELLRPLQPDVEVCFTALLHSLESAGAQVVRAEIGDVDDLLAAVLVIVGSEAFAYQRQWVTGRRDQYSREVLAQVEMGRHYSAVDYIDALRLRAAAAGRVSRLLETADAILTPAALVTAPPVGDERVPFRDGDRPLLPTLLRPLAPFGLTGHPAVSVPIGLGGASGLPVGAQLVGAHQRDFELLAIAGVVQSLSAWEPGVLPTLRPRRQPAAATTSPRAAPCPAAPPRSGSRR